MQISYQERLGIEALVTEEGAAVQSEEQHARLEYHFRQGVTPDGIAL